jgi:hypothetical protein
MTTEPYGLTVDDFQPISPITTALGVYFPKISHCSILDSIYAGKSAVTPDCSTIIKNRPNSNIK